MNRATSAPTALDLRQSVIPSLMKDEGFRAKPYRCTAGKLTIGYGANIEDGIDDDEAMFLLEHRLDKAIADCVRVFPWFGGLEAIRQGVVVQMRYQLGLDGLLGFRNLLRALAHEKFNIAAAEMLDSKWARSDSPKRAQRLALQMRTGRVA